MAQPKKTPIIPTQTAPPLIYASLCLGALMSYLQFVKNSQDSSNQCDQMARLFV